MQVAVQIIWWLSRMLGYPTVISSYTLMVSYIVFFIASHVHTYQLINLTICKISNHWSGGKQELCPGHTPSVAHILTLLTMIWLTRSTEAVANLAQQKLSSNILFLITLTF